MVVNGDVLTDLDVDRARGLPPRPGRRGARSHLTPVDDPSAFGVVPTDDDGRVIAFVEKPPRDEAPTNLINAGTYVLEPSVLDRIPAGRQVSIERETFPAMVAEGRLYAMADRRLLARHRHARQYLEANLDLLGAPRRIGVEGVASRRRDRRRRATVERVARRRPDRRGRRRRRRCRTRCSWPGARVEAGATRRAARSSGRRRRSAGAGATLGSTSSSATSQVVEPGAPLPRRQRPGAPV